VDRLPIRRAFRRPRVQEGAVIVEFALVMPILFLIVFGILDFGYMLNRDTIVGNASRDGARVASLNGSYDVICTAVKGELAQSGIPVPAQCNSTASPTTVTIDCIKVDNSACHATAGTYNTLAVAGTTVIVKVRYVHSWITPGLPFLGDGITLEQVTQMKVEG
jgi:Flp pilus assembly protein TadG